MDILTTAIRDIVREEIAAAGVGSSSLFDPVLITVRDVVELVNENNAGDRIGRSVIDDLIKNAGQNGFPVVRLGAKTIRIDKMRLNRWLASGGLGVKP